LRAAALLAVALLLCPVQALTVRPGRGGSLRWAVPVRAGATFTLTWIHTVSRRPVAETYRVASDGQLHLDEMVFDHPGANLPAGPEGGTTWRIERDRWVVTGYDLALPALHLGVGPYGHWLRVGCREWDLVAGIGPDRSIKLQVERVPLLLIILTEGWQWRSISRRC
jgi:hypothetical protein